MFIVTLQTKIKNVTVTKLSITRKRSILISKNCFFTRNKLLFWAIAKIIFILLTMALVGFVIFEYTKKNNKLSSKEVKLSSDSNIKKSPQRNGDNLSISDDENYRLKIKGEFSDEQNPTVNRRLFNSPDKERHLQIQLEEQQNTDQDLSFSSTETIKYQKFTSSYKSARKQSIKKSNSKRFIEHSPPKYSIPTDLSIHCDMKLGKMRRVLYSNFRKNRKQCIIRYLQRKYPKLYSNTIKYPQKSLIPTEVPKKTFWESLIMFLCRKLN